MMKLAAYPEYKDSGQPFLGEIPAHWNLFRNGRLFSQRNETGFGELPILEVSLKTGVRVRDMDNLKRKQVMSDREKYKRATQGDIAYNMMRMWQGAVGVAPVDGLVSPAYVVVRPFPEVDCNYFSYLFRTASYMNEVDAYSRGIVKDRNRLYWQDFKRMPSPVPPVDEQRHIIRFLDAIGGKAQRFIRNKRRLIVLLKEQKQNVINQAVTRGLDSNVKFKPSGVKWIGDIPEHWEVRRLKFLCHNLNEQTSEKKPGEAYIALEHIESWTGRISLPDGEIIFDSQVKRFRPGDVLFGKLRPYLAKITRPQFSGVCVGEFLVLRVTGKVSADFLEQKLRSKRLIDLINSSTFGAKMPRADWTFIGNLKIAYPPEIEQREILKHIQEKTAEIDQAINRAQREIELMREYRTRLISDVVTGQVDVRGIEVPEVVEEELLAPDEDVAESEDLIVDEGDMEVEE
ncbi:restriction endonuclease subunit S [Desulfobulbus alkaliphilus]|uniref:restriction endonuclease subunit S n=1 Tax=Desulfobulbus alkaliphilus TaxID=869814 RepID=UPI0019644F82|nr:restriction endonuclease subunit S [Desulfobulbus alkaliphilus]MBM9538745.1 restriction endonuclease subunit S [Desulfobulbus alkaliphilus]